MKTSERLLEPLRTARDEVDEFVRERPKSSIFGILLAVGLIGLGIWGWPELHRTIHIHRM